MCLTLILCSLSCRLSQDRKKRKPSASLAKVEAMMSMQTHVTKLVHPSSLMHRVHCMVVLRKDDQVILGGVEGSLLVVDGSSGDLIESLKGHEGEITSLDYASDQGVLCSSSQDGSLRLWERNSKTKNFRCLHVIRFDSGFISSVSCHPSGDYITVSNVMGTWNFLDVKTGSILLKVQDEFGISGRRVIQFHPDGLILAIGLPNARIQLWDLKSQTCAASLEGPLGPLEALVFSENGYYMASSSSEDSCIRLWDLRKLSQLCTIPLNDQEEREEEEGLFGTALTFDDSGQFLAVGTSKGAVSIYKVKVWDEVVHLKDFSNRITSLKFGSDARSLYVSSLDGSVFVYSVL